MHFLMIECYSAQESNFSNMEIRTVKLAHSRDTGRRTGTDGLNNSAYTIREMKSEERSKVVQFMAALNRVEHRFRADRDSPIAAAEQHVDFLQNLVPVNGGFITVAESNKSLCGFLTGVVDSEDGYYILPQKRKFDLVADIHIREDNRGQVPENRR